MPIKWSAVKVSEAIDKVEQQVTLAEPFLDEAKAKVAEAKTIPHLPDYMTHRLNRIIYQIERIDNVKGAIKSARDDIPDGAIEAEQASLKYGSQQSLV